MAHILHTARKKLKNKNFFGENIQFFILYFQIVMMNFKNWNPFHIEID